MFFGLKMFLQQKNMTKIDFFRLQQKCSGNINWPIDLYDLATNRNIFINPALSYWKIMIKQ